MCLGHLALRSACVLLLPAAMAVTTTIVPLLAALVLQQGLRVQGATSTTHGMGMDTTTMMMDMATTMAPTMAPGMTTMMSDATTNGGVTPATVTFSLTIAGINLADLQADTAAMTAFTDSLKSTVAAALTGIDASMVSVTLSSGSIVATVVITVPSSMTAANVGTAVSTAVAGTLQADVVSGLSAISAVANIATGSMTATASEPVSQEATSGSDGSSSGSGSDDTTSSDAWHAVGSVSFAMLAAAVAMA